MHANMYMVLLDKVISKSKSWCWHMIKKNSVLTFFFVLSRKKYNLKISNLSCKSVNGSFQYDIRQNVSVSKRLN